MSLIYWEVYGLIELAMNLRNEDLHWFSGKRTFIHGGVYMRFNGGIGATVISCFHVVFHFLMDTKCFFLYQQYLKIVEAKSL